MKHLAPLGLFALVVTPNLALSQTACPPAPFTRPVRVCCLGDSLVGAQGGDRTFRRPLYEQLAGQIEFDFVGSRNNIGGVISPTSISPGFQPLDDDFDHDHEGYGAIRVEQWNTGLLTPSTFRPIVPTVQALDADVYCIYVGVNDLECYARSFCCAGGITTAGQAGTLVALGPTAFPGLPGITGTSVFELVQTILANSTGPVWVLVSRVGVHPNRTVPNGATSCSPAGGPTLVAPFVASFNAALPGILALNNPGACQFVSVVNPNLLPGDFSPDLLHLNASGEAKLAGAFYDGIKSVPSQAMAPLALGPPPGLTVVKGQASSIGTLQPGSGADAGYNISVDPGGAIEVYFNPWNQVNTFGLAMQVGVTQMDTPLPFPFATGARQFTDWIFSDSTGSAVIATHGQPGVGWTLPIGPTASPATVFLQGIVIESSPGGGLLNFHTTNSIRVDI